MKTAFALFAVAGLAAVANAQISLSWVADKECVSPDDPTVVLTLRASFQASAGQQVSGVLANTLHLSTLRARIQTQLNGGVAGFALANTGGGLGLQDDFNDGTGIRNGTIGSDADSQDVGPVPPGGGNDMLAAQESMGFQPFGVDVFNEANPIDVYKISLTVTSFGLVEGVLTGTTSNESGTVLIGRNTAAGTGNWNPISANYSDANIAAATFSVRVKAIPAPASVALLGLGGLVAARRRRA